MDSPIEAFLDDTTLSKPPGSPLTSSTAQRLPRPPLAAINNDLMNSMFSPTEDESPPAFGDTKNLPSFITNKFSENIKFSFNDSSLGILQMDNMSCFTEASFMSYKNKNEFQSNIKNHHGIQTKDIKASQADTSAPDIFPKTFENGQLFKSFDNGPSCSSVIPDDCLFETELSSSFSNNVRTHQSLSNMDKTKNEGLRSSLPVKSSESSTYNISKLSNMDKSKNGDLRSSLPVKSSESSTYSMNQLNNTNKSKIIDPRSSLPVKSSSKSKSSKTSKHTDSIFKSQDISSDSILNPNRQVCNSFSAMNTSDVDSILSSQSTAEERFLKMVQDLKSESIPLTFSPKEISSRSTSFRPSSNGSSTICSVEQHLSDSRSGRQGPQDVSMASNVASGNDGLFSGLLEEPRFSASGVSSNIESIENCLNFKDTSQFFNGSGERLSDSEFLRPSEVLDRFQKDEELCIQEHKFELSSNVPQDSCNNFSKDESSCWMGERESSVGKHNSIGSVFRARTENLGRLSTDPNRERPYFGVDATTPDRHGQGLNIFEDNSVFSHSDLCTDESLINALNPKTSTESTLFRQDSLSRILNDTSTLQADDLASKILERCNLTQALNGKEQPTFKNQDCSRSSHQRSLRTDPSGQDPSRSNIQGSLRTNQSVRDPSRPKQDIYGSRTNHPDYSRTSYSDPSSYQDYSRTSTANPDYSTKFQRLSGILEESEKSPSITRSASVDALTSPETTPRADSKSQTFTRSSSMEDLDQPRFTSSPNSSIHQATVKSDACSCQQNNSVSRVHSSCSTNSGSQHGYIACYGTSQAQTNSASCFIPPYGCPHQFQSGALQRYPYPVQGYPPYVGYTSGPFMQSGTNMTVPLQGPSELKFPEKICVGDRRSLSWSVQSSLAQQLYYVTYTSVQSNGEPISLEDSGLSFPSIVTSNGSNSIDVQLVISPKHEGNFTISLKLVAPDVTANATLQTLLQYEAVIPNISFQVPMLDLGFVSTTGCQGSGTVVVFYKSEASVLLCFSLSGDMKDHIIHFDLNKLKSDPTLKWKAVGLKQVLYRLPQCSAEMKPSSIEIPILLKPGRTEGSVNCFLTVSIESSSYTEVLPISAIVGDIKLVLANQAKNPLLLRAVIGFSVTDVLTLRNEGDRPVSCDLSIASDAAAFRVTPAALQNLQRGQSASVEVTFRPTVRQVVKGHLQATIASCSQPFTLAELIGDGTASQQKTSDSVVRSSTGNIIDCNVKHLAWCGAEVGSSDVKTFTMRNKSSNIVQAKLFIKDQSGSFGLLDDAGTKCSSQVIELQPGNRTISVYFCSRTTSSVSAILGVKTQTDNKNKIFSIALFGYGGPGQLSLVGVPMREGIGYSVDVCLHPEKQHLTTNLCVSNAGVRPIFVKALVYFGGQKVNPSHDSVFLTPSEFVLPERANKVLYVSLSSEYLSSQPVSDAGFVTLYYGDEVMRQQLKRCRQESGTNHLINNVDFLTHFDDESNAGNDLLFPSMTKFLPVFSKHLKKSVVFLNVEKNSNFSQMTFDALPTFADFSMQSEIGQSRRLTATFHSPTPAAYEAVSRLSMPLGISTVAPAPTAVQPTPVDAGEPWSLKPDFLNLNYWSSNQDNRVVLTNMSQKDLKFRIEYAIDVISVSPANGTVMSKSQIGLRVTIIPGTYNKLSEDYEGIVKVICGGREKVIIIMVKKPLELLAEPTTDAPLTKAPSDGSMASSDTDISCFPKVVVFNTVATGGVSEKVITVQNKEKSSVNWNISPVSRIFSQPPSDGDNVFKIKPTSGTLNYTDKVNVVIEFRPSNAELYFQYFELSLQYENGKQVNCSFKTEGKTEQLGASAAVESSASSTRVYQSSQDTTIKRTTKSGIYLDKTTYEFPLTAVSTTSCIRVEVKNPSAQDIKLNISKPALPFSIRHPLVVVKSKSFLQIPVSFKPTKVGQNEDFLILREPNDNEIIIKLKGASQ